MSIDTSRSLTGSSPRRRLGRYQTLFRIAGGGMAEVYAARILGEGGFDIPWRQVMNTVNGLRAGCLSGIPRSLHSGFYVATSSLISHRQMLCEETMVRHKQAGVTHSSSLSS